MLKEILAYAEHAFKHAIKEKRKLLHYYFLENILENIG